MFIPMPVLIAIGVVFLLLVGWALRAAHRRDPLMGGTPPRRAPLAAGPVAGVQPVLLPPEIEGQVRELLTTGRKLEAIKLTREVTHCGLKEAKDLVESME